MQLHQLQRVHKQKRSQLVGRGGKRGKTSGRGGKGQTARSGHKVRPEFRDVLMRIPKQRGRGTNVFKSFREKSAIVSLADIDKMFSDGASVTPELLVEKGLVKKVEGSIPKIKILGDGEITKKISVSGCEMSENARAKIEKIK